MKIVEVARYSNNVDFTDKNYYFLKKRKATYLDISTLHKLGVCNTSLYDGIQSKNIYTSQDKSYLVLTRYERDLFFKINPHLPPPLCLELMYPWLSGIKYINDAIENYKNLVRIINKFKAHLTDHTRISNQYWNKVCNKIKKSNTLDNNYKSAWHIPLQNVHFLKDYSKNNTIIAIDVNSMYAYGATQKYPKLNSLNYAKYNCNAEKLDLTTNYGLFKCKLIPPFSNFLKEYNPFTCWLNSKRYSTEETEIIVKLNEFEILFFLKHVSQIFIIDGISTIKTESHPLKSTIISAYKRRLNYKKQSSQINKLEKLNIAIAASSTERPQKTRISFNTFTEMLSFIDQELGIKIHNRQEYFLSERYLQQKLHLKQTRNKKFQLKVKNNNNEFSCSIYMQRIVAHSRIKMLETMSYLYELNAGIEFAYYNIDSLHVVCPKKNNKYIYDALSYLTGEKIGDFKVECIASTGLWLEPGKYWLFDAQGNIIKYANSNIGNLFGNASNKRNTLQFLKLHNYQIPLPKTLTLENTLSDMYILENNATNNVIKQRRLSINDNRIINKDIYNRILLGHVLNSF